MGGVVSLLHSRHDENLPPIRLIPLEELKKTGSFPRYPSVPSIASSSSSKSSSSPLRSFTCDLEDVNVEESFIVFISHHWLRSDKNDAGYKSVPHPDNTMNEKYTMCVTGVEKLFNEYVDKRALKNCFLWIDYSCVDQDLPSVMSHEYKNLEQIIRIADCLFTPVVDTANCYKELKISKEGGHFADYNVPDWLGYSHNNRGYLKRSWCLLEMFYAANIPLSPPSKSSIGPNLKSKHFYGRLRLDAECGRRTHFLYGTLEHKMDKPPLAIFPHLENGLLYMHHPLNGAFSDPEDIYKLEYLMNQLLPFMNLSTSDIETKRFKYTGDIDDYGQLQGEGRFEFYDGSIYSGGWLNSRFHGVGQLILSDNNGSYEGCFKNGVRHGQGKQVDKLGCVYNGEWKDDTRWGVGTMIYSNSAVYTGDWVKDKRHGKGQFNDSDESTYHGEYLLDVRHGEGEFVSAPNKDGQSWNYKGRWRDDMFNGFGVMRYIDGSVYEGKWANNKRYREGKLTFPDGSIYEGQFSQDKFHGKGKITYALGGMYEGDWVNGCMHGHGTFQSVDGEVYVGEWENDKKHGRGKCTYLSGATYEGEWKDDMRHGDGHYVGNDGTSYLGRFIKGQKHGYGTFRYADGTTLEGRWVRGESML